MYNAAAVCKYLGISLDEAFELKSGKDEDRNLHKDQELQIQYLTQVNEDLKHMLNSRRIINAVLFGICILLIVTFSFGIIYDAMKVNEGFIQGKNIAIISIILITVIVLAVAGTVLIITLEIFHNFNKKGK